MEMALYYPAEGYYTSTGEKTGSKGDYYTSPYLGNIFGIMIGKQVEEMWSMINESSFTIVEYGAGNGALCYDILTYLQHNAHLFKGLTYYIIEKSPGMIEKEKVMLKGFAGKVKWAGSISGIGDITGCILSNEVIDNFSVHQVMMQQELMEVFVAHDEKFIEIPRPAAEELKEYLQRFNIVLPKGSRAEINLEAESWISEVAAALRKGFVLTIDYGYPSYELYLKRLSGTMQCYHNHSVNNDPFLHVGEQDITTHVNFSSLLYTGVKQGLGHCGFTTQSYFLNSLGLADYLRRQEKESGSRMNDQHMISSIAALITMGQQFKVFIQQKGLEKVALSGMKFPLQLV